MTDRTRFTFKRAQRGFDEELAQCWQVRFCDCVGASAPDKPRLTDSARGASPMETMREGTL
jgi:hypothetical protein